MEALIFGKKRETQITVSFTPEELLALTMVLVRDAMSDLTFPTLLGITRERQVLGNVCDKLRDAARAAKEGL